MTQSGEEHAKAPTYDEEEDLLYTEEDYAQPTLGTAMVERVLLSSPLVQQAEQGYREPLLD